MKKLLSSLFALLLSASSAYADGLAHAQTNYLPQSVIVVGLPPFNLSFAGTLMWWDVNSYNSWIATPQSANICFGQGPINGSGQASTTLACFFNNGGFNLIAGAYQSGGTAGVTCSGTPTSSFASKNGIVTHC